MIHIFISHSHADQEIASLLVDFLLAALEIRPENIRCTSVPGHQLPLGTSIGQQLKKDLNKTTGLIALITKDSLRSTWVLFELGSSWATEKLIVPILGPGLTYKDLPGPLADYPGVRIEDENPSFRMTDVINQFVLNLGIQPETNARRDAKLNSFITKFRDWKSNLPEPNASQQKQIEELTKKLEESGQSHILQLQQIKAAFQKEKKELEQNHQQQIKQLMQQLSRTRKISTIVIPPSRVLLKDFNFKVFTINERGEEVKQETGQAQYFTEDLGSGVTLDMVTIPGGKFMMGSPEGEGSNQEKPQNEVNAPSFFMGKYLITQSQYQQVMNRNPSGFKGDKCPVEKVSWDDAEEFCQRLSKQTGKEYRLPTEAEWEYACRARTTTAFNLGETITDKLVNYYANETVPVGQFPPNAFGLYDMHGNVWEWCQDNWHGNYEDAPTDGSARLSGDSSTKVIRGGSWDSVPRLCRSAFRFYYPRIFRINSIGFRVVCVALIDSTPTLTSESTG